MNVEGGGLYFDALINDSRFNNQLREMERRVLNFSDNSVRETARLNEAFDRLSATLGGVFTIAAAQSFVSDLIRVRGEFQQLEIAFTTMLRSKEKADQLMKEAVALAATTPFGLQDVASGAKQLLAYGTEAENITETLTMLGNVAAGVGAPLNDIVFLYGTLQTQGRAYTKDIQQFTGRGIDIVGELANQFRKEKDEIQAMVEAGKIGFPEIEKAFQSMTSESGKFFNLMQEQSASLTGQISNLEDAWDSMLNTIGEDNEGILYDGIAAAATLVENYDKVIDILGVLIVTYGSYRAALIATAALEKFNASRQVIETITRFNGARMVSVQVTRQLTVAEGLNAAGKRVLTSAQAAYNAVLAASPLIAFTAGIAALSLIIYSLTQVTDAATAAQEKLNDATEAGGEAADKESNRISDLISVIKSQTATVEQKEAAYKKLQSTTRGVLNAYSMEEIAAGKAADSIDEYIKKLREATAARRAFSEYQELADQMDKLNRKGLDGISIWTRLGRVFKNQFTPTSQGIGFGDWAKGWIGIGVSDRVLNQEKEVINSQMDELKKAYDDKWNEIITGTPADSGPKAVKSRTVEVIDKEIKALKEEQTSVSENKKQWQQYQDQITKLEAEKTRITGVLTKSDKKFANERVKILEDISKAEDEAFRTGLSRNDQEIQAVRDKYEALRNEARKAGLGTSVITRIDRIEKSVTGNLRYEQETESFKTQLEKQRDLYAEYEKFKTEAGKEAADKRFAHEDQSFKSYGDNLKKSLAFTLTQGFAGGFTGPIQDRITTISKFLEDFGKNEKQKQNDLFLQALEASKSFEQKKLDIQAEYQRKKDALLTSDINAYEYDRRVKILDQAEKESLDQLKDENVKKLQVFKDLYNGVEDLSSESAKTVVDNARKMLNSLTDKDITPDLRRELEKLLNQTEEAIDKRLPEGLNNLAGELSNIANQVSGIDEAFGKMLGTLANVVGNVGQISQHLKDIKKAQDNKNPLGQISGGIGLVGSGFGVVSSIVSMFDKSDERRARADAQFQYSQELQIKAIEAQSAAMERQLALIKDIYGTERLQKYKQASIDLYKNLSDTISSVEGKYLLTGNLVENEIIKKLNAGQSEKDILKGKNPVSDVDYFKAYANVVTKINRGQLATLDISDDLLKNADSLVKSYEEISRLEDLLANDKLDDATRVQVQALINYAKQYRETLLSIKEEAIGLGFEEITDSIVDMFANGTMAAEDFAKNFEELMKKSIINSFKSKYLEDQLIGFYDTFAKYAEDGLNEEDDGEISKLKDIYNGIISNSQKQWEELQKVTGIDLSSNTSSSSTSSIAGKLQRELTEQTASELMGLYRAQYDLTKREFDEILKQTGLDVDRNAMMRDVLLHLSAIRDNTGNTVEELKKAIIELKGINLNTKPGQSARGLGVSP